MKALHTLALLVGVAILVGGCTSSMQAEGNRAADAANLASGDGQIQGSSPGLEQDGFAVMDFRAVRDEYNMVAVLGEVRNVGPAAMGVELQATLRDTAGRVVAVGHFYPASYRSIVPGESWPFAHSFGRQDDAARAEIRIVGAFRTMDLRGVASNLP